MNKEKERVNKEKEIYKNVYKNIKFDIEQDLLKKIEKKKPIQDGSVGQFAFLYNKGYTKALNDIKKLLK